MFVMFIRFGNFPLFLFEDNFLAEVCRWFLLFLISVLQFLKKIKSGCRVAFVADFRHVLETVFCVLFRVLDVIRNPASTASVASPPSPLASLVPRIKLGSLEVTLSAILSVLRSPGLSIVGFHPFQLLAVKIWLEEQLNDLFNFDLIKIEQ